MRKTCFRGRPGDLAERMPLDLRDGEGGRVPLAATVIAWADPRRGLGERWRPAASRRPGKHFPAAREAEWMAAPA